MQDSTSPAAPAPAATCPTLRRALEEFASWSNWHVKVEGYGPSVRREYIWDGGGDPTDFAQAALDAPTPAAPLTALERATLEAAKEYDLAMEIFPIAQSDGDKETRLVARENVTETKRAFRKALANLARAAVGREGAG